MFTIRFLFLKICSTTLLYAIGLHAAILTYYLDTGIFILYVSVALLLHIRSFTRAWLSFSWITFILQSAVITLVIFVHLHFFVIRVFVIANDSMNPGLRSGNYVVVDLISLGLPLPPYFPAPEDERSQILHRFYQGNPLLRGDIIVFRGVRPDDDEADHVYVKRVIAIPGDKFEIRKGTVFLNEKEEMAPYVTKGSAVLKDSYNSDGHMPLSVRKLGPMAEKTYLKGIQSEVQVPKNSYIVLGDNRQNSLDSRNWGFFTCRTRSRPVNFLAFFGPYRLPIRILF